MRDAITMFVVLVGLGLVAQSQHFRSVERFRWQSRRPLRDLAWSRVRELG